MSHRNDRTAVLLLEDGTYYYGKPAGKIGTTTGEICFNTGMTGYQEVFTDPSYHGQILVMTNDHIGNYGANTNEVESEQVQIAGLVCKNYSQHYSRHLATFSLQDYLEENDLIGISDVDTRAIVRHIRDKGAMNAIISSEETDIAKLRQLLDEVPSMAGLELSTKVTTDQPYMRGMSTAPYKVAVLDLGTKQNILKSMEDRGCQIQVYNARTSFDQMQAWKPDGYFISNGPGDPASMEYAVETTRHILNADKPLFGICLGHQILALALGIDTYKMHTGHRGLNHPVKNLLTGRCEVTTQNHGFGVSAKAIDKHDDLVEKTHINLNDNTVEGFRVKDKQAFSVQYHPESTPGPHDSRYLFDDFIRLMKKGQK